MLLNNLCICYKTLPLNKCYNNTITHQEECSLPEVRRYRLDSRRSVGVKRVYKHLCERNSGVVVWCLSSVF